MPIKKYIELTHLKQSSETSCGAAALAMVYKYMGHPDETEKDIFERLKKERPQTSGEFYLRTPDMAHDSTRHNLSYFLGQVPLDSKENALQTIKEFLSLSIPVIVCQRVDEDSCFGHFRVVVGINNDDIVVDDPLFEKRNTINVGKFMKLWEKTTESEVIGGQFLAIFKKTLIKKKNSFLVTNFESSIRSFTVSDIEFD